MLAGCELVFPLEEPAPADSLAPCTPGELAAFTGRAQTAGSLEDGLLVSYLDPSGSAAVRAVDSAGRLALPRVLFDTGETLRIGANGPRATITLTTSEGTGWDQVISTSIQNGELESTPSRRTPTGVHTTRAAAVSRDETFLLAARSQPGGEGTPLLAVSEYDVDWNLVDLKNHSLDLGDPIAFAAPSATGAILLTSKNIVSLDLDRNVVSSMPATGFDDISLVGGAPADLPALVRTSGGAVELVELNADGTTRTSYPVVGDRQLITSLHAQTARLGVLVIWQEGAEVFALRTVASGTATATALPGRVTTPIGIYQGSAGPIAVSQRDEEIVVMQLCGF